MRRGHIDQTLTDGTDAIFVDTLSVTARLLSAGLLILVLPQTTGDRMLSWRPVACAIAAVVCGTADAEDSGFELKGLTLGRPTTTTRVEQAFEGVRCGQGSNLYGISQVCNGETTLANVNVRANLVTIDGVLARMSFTFSGNDYADMKRGLAGKFGTGRVQSGASQNAFGARFSSEVVTWSRPKGQIAVLQVQTARVGEASLELSTPNDPTRRMESEKRQRKGDL